MKHLKLIAALAMPAMFAACTSEDLYSESNNAPQQMEEVVGYKLLSNGASFQVTGAESRVSASTGNFHSTDLIGLGWVLNGNAASEQFANKLPNTNRLYANHMFSWDEETGFGTKGNIYEGWYFSYYPWAYESKMGPKSFVVNPVQKSKSYDDRVSQRLHISHLQFIGENNINPTNGELELSYQVEKALNILNVRTAVAKGSAFEAKEAEGLDDKAIRSITISTGDANAIFAGKLDLDATKLPVYDTDKSEAENKEALQNKLYAAKDPALAKADLSASVTTQVGQTVGEGEDATQEVVYKVSEKTALTTLVVPATATLDIDKFNIVVNLDNGYFEVNYKSEAEIEAEEREVIKKAMQTNNAAIQTIVNAYKGAVAAAGETPAQPAGFLTSLQENVLSVDVELYDDIFVTDFKHISNIDEWKDAVDLVETLGRAEETFEIDGSINFTTENGGITADGNLYMPSTCQITVKSSNCDEDQNKNDNNLYLVEGTLEQWPANLTSETYFAIEANGVWKNAHINGQNHYVVNRGTIIVPNGTKANVNKMGNYITNNGLIKVGEYAEVSHVTNNGRIEVVWGSYVYTEANNGIVAYEVTQLDVDTPKRIEILTAKSTNQEQNKLAAVNTLVIGKDIEIDLTKSINGTDDNIDNNPYGDFNMGGGTNAGEYYYGDLAAVNFEINNGTVTSSSRALSVANVTMTGGTINNIEISGKLTIEGGHNNVNVNDPQKITSAEIKGGENTIYATEITNVVETVKGRNAIHAEKIVSDLKVNGEHHEIVVTALKNVEVTGSAVISNSNVDGDLTVNSGTTKMENVNINGTLTNKGTVILASENAISITKLVNNATLTSNNDIIVKDVELNPGSVTTLDDLNVPYYDKTIWYTDTYKFENMTLNGTVKAVGDGVVNTNGEAKAFTQEGLNNALTDQNVKKVELLKGEYEIPELSTRTLTIVGAESGVSVKLIPTASNTNEFEGSTLNFNNVTLEGTEYSGNTHGFKGALNENYTNCVFKNYHMFAGQNVEVIDCKFVTEGQYIWTGYAENISFVNCEFIGKDRAVKVLSVVQNGTTTRTVSFKKCNFFAAQNNKAVLEGASGTATAKDNYIINIEDCTMNGAFDKWFNAENNADKYTVNK